MEQDMGASAEPTGLAGAEAPEPHAGLGASRGIPSAGKQHATCIMTNCRRRAPSGEPFCSEHR